MVTMLNMLHGFFLLILIRGRMVFKNKTQPYMWRGLLISEKRATWHKSFKNKNAKRDQEVLAVSDDLKEYVEETVCFLKEAFKSDFEELEKKL